jgi:hypothetical protein
LGYGDICGRIILKLRVCVIVKCILLHYSSFEASCHIACSLKLLNNLRGCNVGIAEGKNSLRAVEIPNFIKFGSGIKIVMWVEHGDTQTRRQQDDLISLLLLFQHKENRIQIKICPTTVVARSKARTVFATSNAGSVGSNPTRSMDVCVRLFCVCVVLCVGSGLAMGSSLVQGLLPTVQKDQETETERPKSNKGLQSHRGIA